MMVVEAMDAASAGFAVGYESPSQFSREYKRLFGSSLTGRCEPLAPVHLGQAFSTCPNSSSTGVERPKISTATRRRLFS